MRLKAQYMFSYSQTNRETSDIKKKSGMGRCRGKVQVLNTRNSQSVSLPPSLSLPSLSPHLSSHHSLSLSLPYTKPLVPSQALSTIHDTLLLMQILAPVMRIRLPVFIYMHSGLAFINNSHYSRDFVRGGLERHERTM